LAGPSYPTIAWGVDPDEEVRVNRLLVLALAVVLLSSPSLGQPRHGFFGISGGVSPQGFHYLHELGVGFVIYGLYIGPEGPPEAKPRDRLRMRGLLELGMTPVPTFWAPAVSPQASVSVAAIVEYFTAGPGVEEFGAPVRYWQIGNEENGGWGTSCPPEEYARRVQIIAAGIRRACPDCTIVMGGLLDGPEMGDWALEPYLSRFLAAGGGEWVNIFNFHYYGLAQPSPRLPAAQTYRTGEQIVDELRRVLAGFGYRGAPIWCTETSTYSGQVGEIFQSEGEQAADLVKRFVLLYALGVEKVFWTYVMEPRYEGTGVGFFDQAGLVYDGFGPYDRGAGVKKRAFFAYRELAARLDGAHLLSRREEAGVSWFRFLGPAGPFSVLWQDPWLRQGPVWVLPGGELEVLDIYGAPVGRWGETFSPRLASSPFTSWARWRGFSWPSHPSPPRDDQLAEACCFGKGVYLGGAGVWSLGADPTSRPRFSVR